MLQHLFSFCAQPYQFDDPLFKRLFLVFCFSVVCLFYLSWHSLWLVNGINNSEQQMNTFKNIPVIITTILCAGFFGCNEKNAPITYDVDMQKYEQQELFAETTNPITAYNRSLNDINEDLIYLCSKNGGTPVLQEGITTREKIAKNIFLLNKLVEENKKKIATLTAEVKKYKQGNSAMYSDLERSKKKLQDYERELESFEARLMSQKMTEDELNGALDELIVYNKLLQLQADKYRNDLSTAYYVCENKKSLKKQGLLVEKGGVLGLGQTAVVNAGAANETNFTQIDIHKVRDIAIHGEHPELMTSHPEGTYEFQRKNNMVTYLHIENPEQFWRSSKYMVVAVR